MNSKPVLIEVAVAELVDKITILEIKRERISDAGKLANIERELGLLQTVQDEVLRETGGEDDQLESLGRELKRVNETLWDTENEIRELERAKDFGPRFIELSRTIYYQNDHRAVVKRRINERLGSRLLEEKSYASYQ